MSRETGFSQSDQAEYRLEALKLAQATIPASISTKGLTTDEFLARAQAFYEFITAGKLPSGAGKRAA